MKNKQFNPTIEFLPEGGNKPFWSVMIPTYNRVTYLEQTLLSVLEQDLDLEVMQIEVVDNCSTVVDVEATVRKIGGDRISFYRQPQNMGMFQNWNTCIKRAGGQWVHILHDDDFVLPGFYVSLREAIEKDGSIGAAFVRHFFVNKEGKQWRRSQLERETAGILTNWLERITVTQRIQCAAIVVKRNVYEQLGGFNTELIYAADWEMWRRIAVYYPVWYEPKLLACYRQYSASETSRVMKTGADIADIRRSIEICEAYLPKESAKYLSDKAREHYAIYALNTAYNMLKSGDVESAIAQIREGLKCSQSPKVQEIFVTLLTETEALLSDNDRQALNCYKTNLVNKLDLTYFRQIRASVTDRLLSLPAQQIESEYAGSLGKVHQMLLESSIRDRLLNNFEDNN